jgi:hypothetical protein
LSLEEVRACGWCLRHPRDFSSLVRLAVEEFKSTDTLRLDWIKAIGQILRFREEITRELDSKLGQSLAYYLRRRFVTELEKGSGGQVFKNVAACIVYLLRRRAFDDSFLASTETLARNLKSEFARAYFSSDMLDPRSDLTDRMRRDFPDIDRRSKELRRKLTVQGGAFDTQLALVQLIDYIDRKGEGYIRFSDDESGK